MILQLEVAMEMRGELEKKTRRVWQENAELNRGIFGSIGLVHFCEQVVLEIPAFFGVHNQC